MKKVSILLSISIAFLATACDIAGKKGEWSSFSKKTFMTTCESEKNDMTVEELKSLCQCSMDKLEAKYDPKELDSKEAMADAEKFGASCAGGTKGNWSAYMKRTYTKNFMAEWNEEVGTSKEDFQKICDCSMAKLEAEYEPLELSIESPEVTAKIEEVTTNCVAEIQNTATENTTEK